LIIRFKELSSTNDYALANLEQLAHQDVVVADIQTKGRGQFERSWCSDNPGNLYMSLVLKEYLTAPFMPQVTLKMSGVVVAVLRGYLEGRDARYCVSTRAPNDVLVDGKKIAGVLAEAKTQGEKVKGCVVGIGVNLNMSKEELAKIDQPATSLNLFLGKSVDKEDFLRRMLVEMQNLASVQRG
jgi:BirA family transcriptional regulator, biotin operon repressor / biotin---[acetyl-CoA-carboxylase] ligase